MTKCICTATCQFRGYVAEKGEVVNLRDEELQDEFLREHFDVVGGPHLPRKKPTAKGAKAENQDELPLGN